MSTDPASTDPRSADPLAAVDLPRLRLADLPTPVEPVDVGGPAPLWVKREDISATPYGGNKVRKLEWTLPQAAARGGHIVTVGAVGSHHALATAFYGAREGIRVHVVLIPQPDHPHVRENAAITARYAHRVWPAANEAAAGVAIVRAYLAAWREAGRRPLLLWIGGSTPRGTTGWVGAGLEIAAQAAAGEVPPPDRVYIAGGSGGCVAGLVLGLGAAGLATRVHAVRVADRVFMNRPVTMLLAHRTRRLLAAHGLRLPPPRSEAIVIEHDAIGGGYGVPTVAGEAAIADAHDLGLELESTYTGKTFAAAVAARRSRPADETILFVDTVSSADLTPLAPADPDDLPPGMDGLFAP